MWLFVVTSGYLAYNQWYHGFYIKLSNAFHAKSLVMQSERTNMKDHWKGINHIEGLGKEQD